MFSEIPGRLAQWAGSVLGGHVAEVGNGGEKAPIHRSPDFVQQDETHARIAPRAEGVNLSERSDLSLEESPRAAVAVTVGPSRNGNRSEDPRPSRDARPLSPVRICSYAFLAALLMSLIVFRVALLQLVKFSGRSEYSYIPLIPLISAFLILVRKESIFENVVPSMWHGGSILAGALLLWFTKDHFQVDSITRLESSALAVVSTWCGLFVLCYGRHASRMALLPLSLLLFMIPAPESVLNVVIQFLQHLSATLSCELFHLLGVPALKEGTVISLPHLTIMVAPECSGIRSSISLLILTFAIVDLYLRSGWNKVLLVLIVVPLVVVKNAIRIVTLSMLGIYVDPGFLNGPLHHRGGILFFLVAVALLAQIVMVMRWLERKPAAVSSTDAEAFIEVPRTGE